MTLEPENGHISDLAHRSESESTLSEPAPAVLTGDDQDIEKAATQSTHRSQFGQAAQKVQTAQDWTGPDDPENPINWPLWQRVHHTVIPGLQCFTM